MSRTIKLLISNWPRTREFSQLLQTGKLLLTFLTMVTRWSRSTSNFYALIGQNLTGEFMRKIYAASWNLFTDSWNWRSFVYKRCEAFNCLFSTGCTKWNTDASKILKLFMAGLFIGVSVEKCAACQSHRTSFSDGSLLLTSPFSIRIIKRVQRSLKRFWWSSGASWLVSLRYYWSWSVFFFWFPKVKRSFCA